MNFCLSTLSTPYHICIIILILQEKKEEEDESAAPGEEGEGDSEKPATDEENSAMREKMIFGRKKVISDYPLLHFSVISYPNLGDLIILVQIFQFVPK